MPALYATHQSISYEDFKSALLYYSLPVNFSKDNLGKIYFGLVNQINISKKSWSPEITYKVMEDYENYHSVLLAYLEPSVKENLLEEYHEQCVTWETVNQAVQYFRLRNNFSEEELFNQYQKYFSNFNKYTLTASEKEKVSGICLDHYTTLLCYLKFGVLPPHVKNKILVAHFFENPIENSFHMRVYFSNLSIVERIQRLSVQLERANQQLSHLGIPLNRKSVKGIFLLPEYYFSHPLPANKSTHEGCDVRHINEQTKIMIEMCLKQISLKHPAWLIFAGTVAWSKPYLRPSVSQAHYVMNKTTRGLGANIQWENHAKKMNTYREDKFKIFQNPEYQDFLIRGNTNRSPDSKVMALQDPSNLTIARNTCFIYHNGVQVFNYDKCTDYNEVPDENSQTVHLNAVRPGIFKYRITGRVVSFGIEICLDHANGVLKNLYHYELFDIHVILSDWVRNEVENYRGNKYVLHSSTRTEDGKEVINFLQRIPNGDFIKLNESNVPPRFFDKNKYAILDLS